MSNNEIKVNDKIFIINNKDHTERLSKTIDSISVSSEDIEIFKAIYPVERKIPFRSHFKNIKDGEFGCLLSHRQCWKRIAMSTSGYTIVIEDDIKKNINLELRFAVAEVLTCLERLPIIFFLGTFDGRTRIKKSKSKYLSIGQYKLKVGEVLAETLWCTYGYAINSSGAKKLLKATGSGNVPVDYFHEYIGADCQINLDDFYATIPNMVVPRGEVSTIRDEVCRSSIVHGLRIKIIDLRNSIMAYMS